MTIGHLVQCDSFQIHLQVRINVVGFVFDLTPLTHNSAGDSDVGEFNEARRTTSASFGYIPTAKTRFRSPRGDL